MVGFIVALCRFVVIVCRDDMDFSSVDTLVLISERMVLESRMLFCFTRLYLFILDYSATICMYTANCLEVCLNPQ